LSLRKRIIRPEALFLTEETAWLDLGRLCTVEVTSEDAEHHIESALTGEASGGWRAAEAGSQLIRLLFDWPQRVGRIRIEFEERERERTQEFALRWSSDGGRSYREAVRQQYTFSPPETTRAVEDYRVELEGMTALELVIVPDVSGGGARASLGRLRLA
jgi:hypothetical protein